MSETYDRNELKILALRERVAQLTAEYEDKVADLRVELTIVNEEFNKLKGEQDASQESPEG